MKRILKKFGKLKKPQDSYLTFTDTNERTIRGAADPMSSVLAHAETQATSATLHEAQVSASEPIAASAVVPIPSVTSAATTSVEIVQATSAVTAPPVAGLEENRNQSPSSPDVVAQVEQNHPTSPPHLGFFTNARNVLITGGTFNNISVFPANTVEGSIKISAPRKPNSSPFFTGQKDVLNTLAKIFGHHTDNLRHSCLLWGMGGIGKTQICLKFTEEMSERFSHVFWIDASSVESITMSLKGISNSSAAQAAGADGSVDSVLQWISCIQEHWLVVFDNADDLLPETVAKFIPPGNRGNILMTSRNQSMRTVIAFEKNIEIAEMEKSDAIDLLLKTSCLDRAEQHILAAGEIVAELGYIPLAINHAGAYIEARKCDISHYLRRFLQHCQTLMSDPTFTGRSNYD